MAQTDRLLNTALFGLLSGLSCSDDRVFFIDHEQVRSWGNDVLSAFLNSGLVIPYQTDITMTCIGCEDACTMPVQIGNGIKQPYIICEYKDNIARVPVNANQLICWSFSIESLSSVLSSLLNSALPCRIISERLFFCGQIETLYGNTDIFLMLHNDDANHPEIKQSVRSILLTPYENTDYGLPAITLRRVLAFKDGVLTLDAELLNKAVANSIPASHENIFKRDADTWLVQYEGKSLSIKHTNGMTYLGHLLNNPKQSYHVSELEQLLGNAFVAESDLSGSSSDMASIRSKLKSLEGQIEDATELGNIEKAEELKDEQDTILKTMQSQTGIDGTPRPANDAGNKARDRIQKAIRTAKSNIKKAGHNSLSDHLENSILTGFSCSYQPPAKIFWNNFSNTKR